LPIVIGTAMPRFERCPRHDYDLQRVRKQHDDSGLEGASETAWGAIAPLAVAPRPTGVDVFRPTGAKACAGAVVCARSRGTGFANRRAARFLPRGIAVKWKNAIVAAFVVSASAFVLACAGASNASSTAEREETWENPDETNGEPSPEPTPMPQNPVWSCSAAWSLPIPCQRLDGRNCR
jgi:hypothetical protein